MKKLPNFGSLSGWLVALLVLVALVNGLSFLVLTCIATLLAIAVIKIMLPKEDFINGLRVFLCVFIAYLAYAFVVDVVGQSNSSGYFVFPDQGVFMGSAERLSGSSVTEMWTESFDAYKYNKLPLFFFLTGLVQKFALVFGEHTMMHQKLHVVWCAAMCQVFVFASLRVFWNLKDAFKYTLYFALLGHFLYFSAFLLRDMHVALLYYIAIYCVVASKKTDRGMWVIPLVAAGCYYLRVESGLFLMAFWVVYLYVRFKEKISTAVAVVALVAVMGGAASIGFLDVAMDTAEKTIVKTEGYAVEGASSSSLGKKLYSLPWGIKHLSIIGFNQMQPFPVWADVYNIGMSNHGYLCIPHGIAAIFWVCCWGMVIAGIHSGLLKKVPLPLLCLLGLTVLLLYLMVSSPDTRRMMCMYLPIYIFAVASYRSFSITKRKETITYSIVALVGLHIVYWGIGVI